MRRLRAARLAALLLVAAGCGGGGVQARPVETLLYVSGTAGLAFEFPQGDPACPGTGAPPPSGIQAPNADHQFGDRVFQTPHLFVMENIQQPVRAVIKNTSPAGSAPLVVFLYLGLTPQVSNVMIEPGECKTVVTNATLPLNPIPSSTQIQVEVCSPNIPNGLDTSCTASPPSPDSNFAFFATIGDIEATSITNCNLPSSLGPVLDACRTPSTFFLEQPKDEVDAVMSVNPGQNPGGPVPNAAVRLELYVDGQQVDFEGGTNPVVTKSF
jgi:hypothetical protein